MKLLFDQHGDFSPIRAIITGITGLIITIFLIVLFVQSTTRVEPGYMGIVYNLNGGVEDKPLDQGFHIHAPWKEVTQYPVSKETVTLTAGKTAGSPDNDSFDVNTKDGKSVNVDTSYSYSMAPDKLSYIFTRFRRQEADVIADTHVKRTLKSAVQSVTTRYSVVEVYGGEKRSEITAAVQKEFEALNAKEGIIVTDFTFQDIRPDEKTLVAIQKIVDAKNQEEFLKQEFINKQQEAKNLELQAQTEKKVADINADKEASVAIKIAEGQAKANYALDKSLTPELLRRQWIEAWAGGKAQVPQVITEAGGNQILPMPDLKTAE